MSIIITRRNNTNYVLSSVSIDTQTGNSIYGLLTAIIYLICIYVYLDVNHTQWSHTNDIIEINKFNIFLYQTSSLYVNHN